jgi:YVTN family beta-propeller protein
MAPEQIEGTRIDGRTDLYALGALLYHLVTGRPPFAGRDALTVAVKQLQEAPRPPSRVEPTIPEEWDALILKALAKAPRDRYQSAGEMQRAIEALPIAPAGSRPGGIRRHTLPAVIAGTGAACVSVMVILAILWAHVVAGQGQSPLQQKLEGYLTSLATQRQLSGTVLVAEKGKILLAQGYGMANRQKNIPNSPTTVYPVPGVGAILVPAALKLEEEGRLHDQDHVCSYLPSCPRSWRPMTIHMVLAGTAGLSNSAWGTFGNTTAQSLANCQGEPLTATPGSGPVNYQSCTGIVLGTIMSRVTHEPFVAAMRQLIFGPAGMRQSGLITDRSPPPGLAQGYSGSALGQAHAYSDFFQLYSTAGDLYRYDNTLFGGRLLSQTALREVVAPRDVVALPDPGIAGARWGYHWKVGSAFGHQVIYTTGNSWSFTGTNMRFPAEGITIIVISNDDQNDVVGVATHVAATLFGASAASPSQAIAPAVAPARAIVAAINVPAGFGIAASPNAIWVPGPPSPPAQVDSGSVVRIDPRTNRVVATVRINDPAGLANSDPAITFVAVGDGQVWITYRVRNSVDRIDPARNRVVARIPVGIHPFGLAIAGHTLWTDNSYEDPGVVNNTIVKVDLRTQKVVARITNAQTHIGQPYLELHATPTALWFTDWGSGTLKRLDSATDKVVATVQTGPQPTSIAVAPGAIWVSNHTSTLVTRVDPATNSMAATIPFTGYTTGQNTASDCCFSATAAGAGAIWTVAGANTRTLVRIDPRTNEATAALTFPQSIDVIAVADGSVWVGTGGRIDRIDPKAVR